MWLAVKYWAGASDRSPVEILSLYGYSATVWIVVAALFCFFSDVVESGLGVGIGFVAQFGWGW